MDIRLCKSDLLVVAACNLAELVVVTAIKNCTERRGSVVLNYLEMMAYAISLFEA